MNGDDSKTLDNVNDEGVDQLKDTDEGKSKLAEKTEFRAHLARFLMIIGLSLIGLFAATWVQNVFIQQRSGQFVLEIEQAEALFWRVLASAINLEYLYAIVGIILCLMAIHMVNRASWYISLPVFLFLAWANAVFLVLGFLGLIFVLDWNVFWSIHSFSAALLISRFLMETGAFIAIIVVEMPYLRRLLHNWHANEKLEEV